MIFDERNGNRVLILPPNKKYEKKQLPIDSTFFSHICLRDAVLWEEITPTRLDHYTT